jgi:hypothetical protein
LFVFLGSRPVIYTTKEFDERDLEFTKQPGVVL